MDPITIAMGLASFAPQVLRWITGSEKAEQAAQAVVDVAQRVTGSADPIAALKADPAAVLAFRQALAAQEADLDKAFLADRADARHRDVALAQAGVHNRRADIMVAMAAVGLLACLAVLTLYRDAIPGEVVGLLASISGLFGACLRDAFQFEFGSSRGSREKDVLLSKT